jgi:hypothetical protein
MENENDNLQVLDIPAPSTGLKSLEVLTNVEDLPKFEPKPSPIKPVFSNKVGIWNKHEDGGLVAWVRKGGLATVEGSKEEGWVAIVPSKEAGGGKLGPFKRASLAKRASEIYLHEEGFVYYREDIQRNNELIRNAMRQNRSRKM